MQSGTVRRIVAKVAALNVAAVAAVVAVLVGGSMVRASEQGAQDPMAGDAELADVFFLDVKRGWAVGDRGVVWHTEDAGRHWRLQPTGVSCRLESVWFVDEERGWAAGGWTHPYTHSSQAVVLRTYDGGLSWSEVRGLTMPALRSIRFFDRRNGWAAGGCSAMYPSGVYRTSDAGRTWIPMTRGPSGHWRSGAFANPLGGAVIGADGSLAVAQQFELLPARAPDYGMRRPRSLRLDAAGNGWLGGEGGMVLATTDGGRSWNAPTGALPPSAAMFDFTAVDLAGSNVWLAGTPGTRVFHSPDGGRTWRALSTSQRPPIHAVTFADERRGWAVGALGTILATSDGGETWTVQHSGGERAALLTIMLDPADLPLELYSHLAAGEGYLSAVELIGRRGLELPPAAGELEEFRAREALSTLGVSATSMAWRFPLRQAGLRVPTGQVIEAWNRTGDGRGLEKLEEHLVQRIRLWRPDVIITEPADPRGERPLLHLVNQAVLSAVEKAGGEGAYPLQLSEAGLEAWTVKKVYTTDHNADASDSGFELVTAQLVPVLGRSLADHASTARGLIHRRYLPEPEKLGFRLVLNRLTGAARRDVFSGILVAPGGDARRPPRSPASADIAMLQNLSLRRRTISRLLDYGTRSSHGGAAWLAQLDDLTRGLSPAAAGETLYQLAGKFEHSGRSELAADVLAALIERDSEHPLSEAAMVWLLRYYTSGEAAWRLQRETKLAGGRVSSQIAAAATFDKELQPSPSQSPSPQPRGATFQVDQGSATTGAAADQNRALTALRWGKLLESGRPSLFAEPRVRFPLSVAQRSADLPRQAEQWLNQLAGQSRGDAWGACAEMEQWLVTPAGRLPPKPVARCLKARQKPHLDGRLDDAVWRGGQPLDLRSTFGDDGAWPAAVLIARDDEYLYLAASCRKAPGAEYPAGEGARPRDADLSGRDRIDVLIDIDRDWSSFYRLTIDHRGWTAESCLEDPAWNPQWFVAAREDETSWTVEAAIPLEELAPPTAGPIKPWTLGLQRTVPGVGFQSWTRPAAVNIRTEGFGVLVFP